jgi:hypothetical protein
MEQAITQRQAKVLIRDYLRETGRKGVTSFVRDIHRYTKSPIFTQRTLEKWLAEQDRNLQDENWDIVLDFIKSKQFKQYVPYANEGRAAKRLAQVGDGLAALYGEVKSPGGVFLLPSQIEAQGKEAIKLLSGNWENVPNLKERDVPRTICTIEPVPDKRYAKFAYMALFRSKQISTTGIVIYLNSEESPDYDYCHSFVLQLWRRKDPETGTTMPGELTYLTLAKNQPELSVSNVVNQYFYKSSDPAVGDAVILKISRDPILEETEIIDSLLEDVLLHGSAEA